MKLYTTYLDGPDPDGSDFWSDDREAALAERGRRTREEPNDRVVTMEYDLSSLKIEDVVALLVAAGNYGIITGLAEVGLGGTVIA